MSLSAGPGRAPSPLSASAGPGGPRCNRDLSLGPWADRRRPAALPRTRTRRYYGTPARYDSARSLRQERHRPGVPVKAGSRSRSCPISKVPAAGGPGARVRAAIFQVFKLFLIMGPDFKFGVNNPSAGPGPGSFPLVKPGPGLNSESGRPCPSIPSPPGPGLAFRVPAAAAGCTTVMQPSLSRAARGRYRDNLNVTARRCLT